MSTLCTAWVMTRKDGERLGFTDHDEPLDVDDVTCRPTSGFTASSVETQLGFAADNAELQAVLDDESLRAEDIEAGLYAQATIQMWSVDWTFHAPPDLRRTQTLLSITRESTGRFTAEVVGLGAALERVSGRVVSRMCAAEFGDARCGLIAANFPDGTQCARTYSACKSFNNAWNYRGFPRLIGEDALVQGPTEGLPRDGGSRYGDGPNV